jgi:polysaccharide export outer membrane protein
MAISRFLSVVASICLLALVLPQGAAAQIATPPASGATAGDATSEAYVLGRDDVLEVNLLGRSDFSGRSRVQADGTIQLPLIGKVVAADKTTAELGQAIRGALQAGGFFADPIVNIEVVSYASRYITVLGNVVTPGLVPINRPYRLSEIMARVGGLRENAADYIVVRPRDGPEKRYVVADIATGDSKQDPYVTPGDKIYSPQADTFYIYGSVNMPGAYALKTDMTVRQAIARGGGLTEAGSDKRVEITRQGKPVKVDLTSNLMAGDVLHVGERLF